MPTRAPRLLSCMLHCRARGALLAVCVVVMGAAPAVGDTIVSARFTDPTDRYAHGILGDAIEWGALELTLRDGSVRTFTLPQDHVFEDVAPRLADLDGDGAPEVIVVESDMRLGGALAVYGPTGKITETPHIGRTNRWLAPIGAADLDGDGNIEIAYVDRPHLAKVLRVWRYQNAELVDVAAFEGVTNHRIGEVDIAGGIRTCNGTPEMIVATANWSHLLAVKWDGGGFIWSYLGEDTTRPMFARALECAE
ncbi:FG-GAP repeat domain-containing protein [Tateyamaria sp. SN3-11]|uniref:FG-GAP repeat domain-containing protein n=1 Tax=Tateyamaria sp. SN3-11 TaxID=3092147 RepID=UPI0039E8E363